MVRLFVSDRILIDGQICAGGIAVSTDGKIEEVFKNETDTSEWMDKNRHVEVNLCQKKVHRKENKFVHLMILSRSTTTPD